MSPGGSVNTTAIVLTVTERGPLWPRVHFTRPSPTLFYFVVSSGLIPVSYCERFVTITNQPKPPNTRLKPDTV